MAALPDWQPLLQQQLEPLTTQFGEPELLWASGYLAGVAAARGGRNLSVVEAMPAAQSEPGEVLHIWYGSQTGNGRGVAETLAEQAQARGLQVKLADLAEVPPRQIKKVKLLTLVVSTHGEGDPPDDAEALYEYLHGDQAPKLDGLRYAVFALGDSSYERFCQTGTDFDIALEKLGGERALACAQADVDYQSAAAAWQTRVIETFNEAVGQEQPAAMRLSVVPGAVPAASAFTRDKPFAAEVLASGPLTVAPSAKTVHHVELSLEGSGLIYQPGDSLGVWPRNPAPLVEELLTALKLGGDEWVRMAEEELPAREWLETRLELTQLTRPFLEQYAKASRVDELNTLLADGAGLRAFIEQHQVIDVLHKYPAEIGAGELFAMLRRLSPRSYSIASSPLAAPDEVHLTVRTVGGWQKAGFEQILRAGAASWYLNSAIDAGEQVDVFLESNQRFHLPEDHDAPIIMVGPGTGVAPFRAFVEHRAAQGAAGKNWLFFGEQHRRTDFLYQLEWQRHLKSGALNKLSLAFSRDQERKVYVQDRLHEAGRAVYDWLESGAYVYVCGDSKHMAPDVERALLDVIAEHSGGHVEQAAEYLKVMKHQGRYRKDVY